MYKKLGIDKTKVNLETVTLRELDSWYQDYQDALAEMYKKRLEYQNMKFEFWLDKLIRDYSYNFIKYTYNVAKENGENRIVEVGDEGEFSVLEVFSKYPGYKIELLARTTGVGVHGNDWIMIEWKIIDMGVLRKEGTDFINLGLPVWAKYME